MLKFFKEKCRTTNQKGDEQTQLNWHEDFIPRLANIIRPKVYCELGLYQCVVFNKIIPYSEKLIGVDVNPDAGKYMHKSNKTIFINMSTSDYAKELHARPIGIDMLYIDADHSKVAVLNDFQNYFPFVKPHGLIIMHDGHPKDELSMIPGYCGDGWAAIEELSKNAKEYEMVTIPVHPGLTICRKRKFQLAWQEKRRSTL
jgi:predicted O-methyltransferase YrrM